MVCDEPVAVEGFRRAYAEATGDAARLPAFAFGDSPAMAHELGGLVQAGRKRATAALLADLERDGDPVPEPADRSIVLDGRGEGLCVVETVEVRVGPLGSVDPAFAWDEGEGDRTLEDWLDAHRRFFARRCANLGLALSDDLPVVFERFAVVWPEADMPAIALRRGDARVRELRFDEPGAEGLPGLVAERAGHRLGVTTFRPWPGGRTEVVTLEAADRGDRELLRAGLEALARREGWRRLDSAAH